jgi:hypothetical protein
MVLKIAHNYLKQELILPEEIINRGIILIFLKKTINVIKIKVVCMHIVN